jgi:uncharacterized membrane protein (DUF373 family)
MHSTSQVQLPRRVEAAPQSTLHHERSATSGAMVSQPVPLREETTVTAVSPTTSTSGRTWLETVNRGVRRCDAALVDGADQVLDRAERIVNRTVAIVLMGIAMFAVISSIVNLATTSKNMTGAMTDALDSLLFAVIVVEITATMRREERHSKLKWYLVIGIISAVREILMAVARMSLQSMSTGEVHSTAFKMGVAMAVILGLALALRMAERGRSAEPSPTRGHRTSHLSRRHSRTTTAAGGGHSARQATR